MKKLNRILKPQDRVLLNFFIASLIAFTIPLIIFHNADVALVFIFMLIIVTLLYLNRKSSSYLLTEEGILGQNPFRRIFMGWEDIRMVDYQDPKLFGLNMRGYPKIILVSRIGTNINLMIEQYDRKDILSLIDDVVARGKNLTINEKLKVTMDYRMLPKENIF